MDIEDKQDVKRRRESFGTLDVASLKALRYELRAENDQLPGPYVRQVTLDRVRQSEGGDKWAVRCGSACLNKKGYWEYEPMPSSRTDEFIALTRFDTELDAIAAWWNRQEP